MNLITLNKDNLHYKARERPKNVNHISDSAFGKFQTIFERRIYLCSMLYYAPWVKYCSYKDSAMNYATQFFSLKIMY
jgi:hypothetical protein